MYVEGGGTPPTITGSTIQNSPHDGIAVWNVDFDVAGYKNNTFTNNSGWDIYDYFNDVSWNQ